jgi:hypothetical protein
MRSPWRTCARNPTRGKAITPRAVVEPSLGRQRHRPLNAQRSTEESSTSEVVGERSFVAATPSGRESHDSFELRAVAVASEERVAEAVRERQPLSSSPASTSLLVRMESAAESVDGITAAVQ